MPGLGTIAVTLIVLGLAANTDPGSAAAAGIAGGTQPIVSRGDSAECAGDRDVYGAVLLPGHDGLMTGLHARTGWSLRGIRTAIDFSPDHWLADEVIGIRDRVLCVNDWAADPAMSAVVSPAWRHIAVTRDTAKTVNEGTDCIAAYSRLS